MFPCMYPSQVCMSSERMLEVKLYCECHMPEKNGIMTVAEKFLKKYFTNKALDYFCSKVCQNVLKICVTGVF